MVFCAWYIEKFLPGNELTRSCSGVYSCSGAGVGGRLGICWQVSG